MAKYTYPPTDPFLLLQQQIKALEDRIQRIEPGIYPEEWNKIGQAGEPAFQNSWINYGSGYDVVSYMRDAAGFVHLRGAATGGSTGTVIFTLPINYRPLTRVAMTTQAIGSGFGSTVIETNGNVALYGVAPIGLDGILFRTT